MLGSLTPAELLPVRVDVVIYGSLDNERAETWHTRLGMRLLHVIWA
jgi:hypothetical protein